MPVILCMPELPLKLQVLETHAMFISLAMAPQGMPQWLLRIKWNNHDRKSFLLPFSAPGSLDLAVETLKASHQSNLLDYCFWLTRTCCLLREWHRGAALGQEGHLAWWECTQPAGSEGIRAGFFIFLITLKAVFVGKRGQSKKGK